MSQQRPQQQARRPLNSAPGSAQSERPELQEQLVVMGQVLAPFGVKGWLKIRPFTDAVDGLLEHRCWLVAPPDRPGEWRSMKLLEGHAHGSTLVARLDNVSDRNEAEHLAGSRIAVQRDALAPTVEGEFYWADLVGLSVVNEQGLALGVVVELLDTGAHAVLRVEGERERLIPFVEAFVREVDQLGKVIRVDWQPDY